jgi:hypothetical protein
VSEPQIAHGSVVYTVLDPSYQGQPSGRAERTMGTVGRFGSEVSKGVRRVRVRVPEDVVENIQIKTFTTVQENRHLLVWASPCLGSLVTHQALTGLDAFNVSPFLPVHRSAGSHVLLFTTLVAYDVSFSTPQRPFRLHSANTPRHRSPWLHSLSTSRQLQLAGQLPAQSAGPSGPPRLGTGVRIIPAALPCSTLTRYSTLKKPAVRSIA